MNKKATINDVAQAANCSTATVSRVLNTPSSVREMTKKRIYKAMLKVGYDAEIPDEIKEDKWNKKESSHILLVLIPSIENPFYFEILNGIDFSSKRLGYRYILYQTGNQILSLSEIQEIILQTHVCGVIVMHQAFETETLNLLNSILPVVQCCEYDGNTDISYVSIDDFNASRSLIEFMLSKGKRNICLINGPHTFKYATQRQAGYEQALKSAGIDVNPQFVVEIPEINFSSALSVISQILNLENRPDSFFAVSDMFAAAAVKACLKANLRVPEDIGIVGFDNTNISVICNPSLTTINQPKFQLGTTACELLIQKIDNILLKHQHIILETELIIRDSL